MNENEVTPMPPGENHRMVLLATVPNGRIEISIPAPFGVAHPTTVSQLEKFFPLFLEVCKQSAAKHPVATPIPHPQAPEGEKENAT